MTSATGHPGDRAARQADLLARARRRSGAERARTARPLARAAGAEPAPLSHAQQRMWLMDSLGQGGARYHVPLATRLRGPFDPEALATALTALTARHAVLRTRYGQRDGRPCQEVGPVVRVPVAVVPAAEQDAPALLHEEAAHPFDLATGPVLRALALRHAPEDHTLLLTLHHIAVDGGSLPVLTADLQALYAAAVEGRPADLPDPGPQYADYARWERERDAELAAAADERAARLAGTRPLPLLRPVPPGTPERRAALHTAPLPAATLDGLRQLGARHGATLFTVVLAAAFAALRIATGEPDLTVGCAGGHRARPELRRLVGLQVNTLPVRADLSGDPRFTEVLAGVRAAQLDAQQHQHVPFDLVVARLDAAARGADGTPPLAVSCDLVRPAEPLALPGLTAEPVEIDLGLAKFGLTLLVEEGPRPRCLLQHDPAALDAEPAGRLLAGFAELLAAVAADPDRRLSALPGTRLAPPAPAAPHSAAPHSAAPHSAAPHSAAEPAAAEPAAGAAGTGPQPPHPAVAALLADPRVADAAVVDPAAGPAVAYAGPQPAGCTRRPSPGRSRAVRTARRGRPARPAGPHPPGPTPARRCPAGDPAGHRRVRARSGRPPGPEPPGRAPVSAPVS
ncbi:condensation domain-containing protein [Kitasatospora sp. A2-31]|uniref:condensation domain-containing protein n=1 Tax=Kitasatospora sp. A2-31 TaxID=2916414 RepID=UPI001EEBCFAD|nr:condensation domain-containing protein [Kitasatospora sp. A2-31]MCG6498103.1 condensation domain-containing protein [Kitasatospora sp. A2-31]